MAYIVRLDSETRIRVFETQLVDAKLTDLRKHPTYNNLLRHYRSLLRASLNISRYILMKENNSKEDELFKLGCIDNALEQFVEEALDIINNRRR